MFKHRYIRAVSIGLYLLLIALELMMDVPWYAYLALLLFFLSCTFLGSYFIRLNYFVHSLCHGDRSKKEIAITFDDGPHQGFTPPLLDLLKKENVPATFFLIGKNIAGNEKLVQRMTSEGHLIGNHSFEHGQWLSLQSEKELTEDAIKCRNEIKRVTGLEANLYRPPYGVTNPNVASMIEKNEFKSIGWSLRTYDTVAKSAEQLLEKTLKKLKNGDVILFHDSGPHTFGMLSVFISEARKRGFSFVGLDSLLGIKPYN